MKKGQKVRALRDLTDPTFDDDMFISQGTEGQVHSIEDGWLIVDFGNDCVGCTIDELELQEDPTE